MMYKIILGDYITCRCSGVFATGSSFSASTSDEKTNVFTRTFSNAIDKASSRNSYLTSLNTLRYFVRIACLNININERFTIQSNLIIQIVD